MTKQTGLQYLETIFRYLASTLDGFTTEEIKNIFVQALSEKEGDYIMTLAEKLKEEGKIEGKVEGLHDTIELGITLKFPDHLDDVMNRVKGIHDLNVLTEIKESIKTAENISQILSLIK
nr:hypothetical protein [uncultured Desulfobacter sp.]